MLHNQYSAYSPEEGQLWGGGGVRVGTPEPTSHFPHEEAEDTVGRDLLRQGSANGQGGGRIQDPGPGGPTLSSSFIICSLPVPARGPGMSTAEQDVAGNRESRGKGIHEAKLASGSESLCCCF